MKKKIILKVENICKTFPGTKALKNVSFELAEGEVYAIIGENGAGKSTLMNILSGVLQADKGGKIFFYDKEVKFNFPREAQEKGVGFVHQELSLCPHVSVAENIFMGRAPKNKFGNINFKKLYQKTTEILSLFDSDIKASEIVKNLNVSERQIVEIAKALSLNCKILILDEPTSSLTSIESEKLFKVIRSIKKKNIGILYISHRLEEIFKVCDRVTILRDGFKINSFAVDKTSSEILIENMVGREINNFYPEKSKFTEQVIMSVSKFNKKGVFEDINFNLKKGEILGFAGLIGAGRTEVARAICGIDTFDGGEVFIEGKKVKINSYNSTIELGLGYITEDRKNQGLFLKMNVRENISAASLQKVTKNMLIKKDLERINSNKLIEKINIKVSNIEQKMNSLSGGNQQKVLFAKWLNINPRIIIMDEPTRGIDVGAKAEMHRMIRELAESGIGVIIISSELPEIIGMCDRVIVMHEGKITGEVSNDNITEKNILMLASKK